MKILLHSLNFINILYFEISTFFLNHRCETFIADQSFEINNP